MNAMFNSMDAGVGNLVAEGNKKRIMLGIRRVVLGTFPIELHGMFRSLYAHAGLHYFVDRP